MSLLHERAVAERLARAAGQLILGYFRKGVPVEEKPGEGPVTRADREANEVLLAGLRAEFPEDGILSEESPDDGSRLARRRVWMIDPLDGTSDFVRDLPGFSVMLGLAIDGRPALGVMYQPVTGLTYRAALGEGAEAVRADGSVARLRVSTVADLAEIRLVSSQTHRSATIGRVREVIGIRDEESLGSVGLKLGVIAEGKRDLYVNPFSRSSLWDTCGPQILLEEAGGRLTDLRGAPLDYLGPSLRNRLGLLASNGLVHDEVARRIAPLFAAGAEP